MKIENFIKCPGLRSVGMSDDGSSENIVQPPWWWTMGYIPHWGRFLGVQNMITVLITWLCEINLMSLYKHRVFLVKSTGSLKSTGTWWDEINRNKKQVIFSIGRHFIGWKFRISRSMFCSGWFQNFVKNLGLIFSQITLKNMWLH